MQACVGAGCVVRHVSRDVATRFGQGRLYLSSWQYVEARSEIQRAGADLWLVFAF